MWQTLSTFLFHFFAGGYFTMGHVTSSSQMTSASQMPPISSPLGQQMSPGGPLQSPTLHSAGMHSPGGMRSPGMHSPGGEYMELTGGAL